MTLSRDERAEVHDELLQQARFYEREHAGRVLRVKQVQGFPVGIVYFVDGAQLVILAYAHHQRANGYWSARFGEPVDTGSALEGSGLRERAGSSRLGQGRGSRRPDCRSAPCLQSSPSRDAQASRASGWN